MVSFCLGWWEKWVRLVKGSLGFPDGRRSRWLARLQGSRGGGGEGGAGRAKLLWEKGIGGQMLESTGDAVGTVGFVSDGHGRNLADSVPSFLLWRLGELLATSAGKTFDGRAA